MLRAASLAILALWYSRASGTEVGIVANMVGDAPVQTVAQLQALLDTNPNTVFRVSRSHWKIDATAPKSIWLRDNRTIVMDDHTLIEGTALMPSTHNGQN